MNNKKIKISSLLIIILFLCIGSFAQNAIINTSRSNIKSLKRPCSAIYSNQEGLTLSFSKINLSSEEIKELKNGYFIANQNITLTTEECKALKAPMGTTITAGKYPITQKGDVYTVSIMTMKK